MNPGESIPEAAADAQPSGPKSRIVLLVTALNVILLGGLLYKSFGEGLSREPGISIVLINDTPSPLIDVNFEYPGGKVSLPRIDPKNEIGSSVQVPGEFEAVVSFMDEAGNTFREPIQIKPVGELSLLLYIQPVLEKLDVTTQDGKVMSVLKPSTSRVRVLPCFRGAFTSPQ
jgi:hypothetical protein